MTNYYPAILKKSFYYSEKSIYYILLFLNIPIYYILQSVGMIKPKQEKAKGKVHMLCPSASDRMLSSRINEKTNWQPIRTIHSQVYEVTPYRTRV